MTIDPSRCVICQAGEPADDWTAWTLPADIRWRGAFTNSDEPPVPAGQWTACPTCSAWIPQARAGGLPLAVRKGLDDLLSAVELHPMTRRKLHGELIGRFRHLAAQLQRADG
jgi:hypothetical protein